MSIFEESKINFKINLRNVPSKPESTRSVDDYSQKLDSGDAEPRKPFSKFLLIIHEKQNL